MSTEAMNVKEAKTAKTEKTAGNKSRLLFLLQYLMDNTDDDHVLTMEELIQVCEDNGFKANRHTVADDINILNDGGIEILSERRGKGNVYHIGSRLFELSELKMLVDAVSSSRFITTGKSETLIQKLVQLTNLQNREMLTAKIYTSDRIKTFNTTVFLNIDTIARAIESGKKIQFHIWNYNQQKEKVLRHDGEVYVASPWALIWDDDRYYVASYSDKRDTIISYRIDRMCDVKELDEPAVIDETFNPSEYARRTMKMFSGGLEEQEVVLHVDNDNITNVIDKFGEEIEIEAISPEAVIARITVKPSSTFFSWVFQFKGKIRIAGPNEVLKEYQAMAKEAVECN